jgi:hypothetical protein
VLDGGFAGAIGGNHHEAGGRAAAGECGDEIERGIVGPVEIFEDKNEGRFRAQLFEGGTEVADGAFVGGATVGVSCGFRLVAAGEPCGCDAG